MSVADDMMEKPYPTETPYPSPRYAWYVVAVLTLLSVFSLLDSYILSLLVQPIRRDLDISDTQMSLLLGFSYAVFYGLFGVVLGRLADSWNRRNLIVVGCTLWSLVTAGCGLARTYAQLLLLRMGLGVGEATMTPAGYSLITDYFPKERLATAMSVFSMSIHIGQGLAYILGGLAIGLVASHGMTMLPIVGAIRPWQIIFFIIGLPGLLLALLMYTVKEPARRDARVVKTAGKLTAAEATPREVARYFFKNKGALICHMVGFGLIAATSYTVWGPSIFMRNYGWSAAQTGVVYGLETSIVGILGVLAGGFSADWLAKRGYRDANMRVGLIATLAWFPTGVLFPLMPTAGWAVVLLIPTYFFSGAPWGAAAAALQQLMPNSMRGQATGVYRLLLYFISGGIGPTLIAVTTDYLFHDDHALKYSLVIVGSLAHLASAVLLWKGLKYFRDSLDRMTTWTTDPTTTATVFAIHER
ncbi:MAG: spinster family MFS transporter [Steroidobacteraceae bacterium]